MLLDYSDTQDEMDKLAFTLDRNKFSRSSSFTAGQDAEPVDSKPQVSQGRFVPLPLYLNMHGPMTFLLTNVASKALSCIPFIASIVGIEGGGGKGVAGASPQPLFFIYPITQYGCNGAIVLLYIVEKSKKVKRGCHALPLPMRFKPINILTLEYKRDER